MEIPWKYVAMPTTDIVQLIVDSVATGVSDINIRLLPFSTWSDNIKLLHCSSNTS